MLGAKHPRSLGQSVRECWAEIWDLLKPLIDTPFEGGPATWMDDLPVGGQSPWLRRGNAFTIAYSPVPDETAPNGIGGVLATVHEITEKVIGERRIAALRDLGARTAEGKTAEEACAIAARLWRAMQEISHLLFSILSMRLASGHGWLARLASERAKPRLLLP